MKLLLVVILICLSPLAFADPDSEGFFADTAKDPGAMPAELDPETLLHAEAVLQATQDGSGMDSEINIEGGDSSLNGIPEETFGPDAFMGFGVDPRLDKVNLEASPYALTYDPWAPLESNMKNPFESEPNSDLISP